MRASTHSVILAGLVLLAGLVIYLPGLPGPLFFDDKPALIVLILDDQDGDPLVSHGSLQGLKSAASQ